MFWGHALGQATPGYPCQLLLAQGIAPAGTVCFLWLLGLCWASLGIHLGSRSSSQGPQQQAGGRDEAPSRSPSPLSTQMRLSPSPGKPGGAQHPFPRMGRSGDLHLPVLCQVPALPCSQPAMPTQGLWQDRQCQAAGTRFCAL